jgi:Family of unknown function (DUF6785)/Domain of unknown function (DUF6784)
MRLPLPPGRETAAAEPGEAAALAGHAATVGTVGAGLAPFRVPRFRAFLLGAFGVIALALLIPYFGLSLYKFDWAFRPLATGPIFLLFLLALPINTLLRRLRPAWGFTGPELLLAYAMMAICAALAAEGLFDYATVNSVHPLYFGTPENRWGQLIMPNAPLWLQVNQPEAVVWYFEGKPPGAATPWAPWVAPMLAWSAFALALYTAFFSLGCLLRKDWIEGQRLAFPIAAVPIEMAGDAVPSASSAFFRSPLLWAGFSLPVLQSLVQMAHALVPAVPYTGLYFNVGRWFAGNGPWDSISDTHAYIGFETIGILALMPADVSLSLWLFFLLNRLQVLGFAALGYGQEGRGASQFSPSAFITYQEAGGAIALALLLLWQSRRTITGAFRSLVGRPAPYDPMDPISPRIAAALLIVSAIALCWWARRAGMDLWAFGLLMVVFFSFSLATARLVGAAGVYVPDISMAPRRLLVGLTGAAAYSPASLTMLTYFQATFMNEWKVNFLHYGLNDMKVLHTARVPGRAAAWALLLAVVLMLAIAPWAVLHAAYTHGAQNFDAWGFREMGNGEFGQLADSLRFPEPRTPFLALGLLCGGAIMLALSWLHLNLLWWGVSPIGFLMGGTWGLNDRVWTNAFIAWLVVVVLIRVGGLRLYRQSRPVFLGMAIGHCVIMALRSMIDPPLGLHMFLTPW